MEALKKMSEEARQRDTQNECVKREREIIKMKDHFKKLLPK